MSILKLLGWIFGFILLLSGGTIAYEYHSQGPFTSREETATALQRLASYDLAQTRFHFDEIKKVLGEPERISGKMLNANELRWYRGAVTAITTLGTPELVSLGLHDEQRQGMPPGAKSVFRGSILSIRIGDPVPTGETRDRVVQMARKLNADAKWTSDDGFSVSFGGGRRNFFVMLSPRDGKIAWLLVRNEQFDVIPKLGN
jgi:hypothetical protein